METRQPANDTDSVGEIQSRSYFAILPWLVLAVALAITHPLAPQEFETKAEQGGFAQ